MNPLASFLSRYPLSPLHLRPQTMDSLQLSPVPYAEGLPGRDSSLTRVADHVSQGNDSQIDSLRSLVIQYENALLESEQECDQLHAENRNAEQALIRAEAIRKAAEEAVASHARFLAVIAHELRGPLAAVRFATAAVGTGAPSELQRARMQVIITRQVDHASRLIEDLVDLTRARTGKLRMSIGLVDMRDVINTAVGICRHSMDRRGQTYAQEVPPSALPVLGDSVRLTQVLNNLLENASRYTPDGGAIKLSVVVEGECCALTVADSGIGMTMEAALVAFNALSQEARAVAFNGDGLGLGLAIVRELVEAHRGTVTGRSEGHGRGSRFVVTLPLAQTPPFSNRGAFGAAPHRQAV